MTNLERINTITVLELEVEILESLQSIEKEKMWWENN